MPTSTFKAAFAALLFALALTVTAGTSHAKPSFFDSQLPQNANDSQLERAAAQGNTDAQYLLGYMLTARAEQEELSGWKTKSNMIYRKAADWFHRAAVTGHAKAQFSIGYLQYEGKGVSRDLRQAKKWFEKAASQHVPDAMFLLGAMHANGEGVRQNRGTALQLFANAGVGFAKEGRANLVLQAAQAVNTIAPGHQAARDLAQLAEKVAKAPKQAVAGGMSTGTGWVVGKGFIATNHHVIAGHNKISIVMPDGTYIPARVSTSDPANDLALLEVEDACKLPPAIPVAANAPGLGAEVFTVGFPQVAVMGASPKLSTGRITGMAGIKGDPRTYQITMPITHGNSGGPLVNMNGEAVGVIVAILNNEKVYMATGQFNENVSYAIKIDRLKPLLEGTTKSGGVTSFIKGFFKEECPGTHKAEPGTIEKHASSTQQSVFMIIAE